jgi:hypothetical protein
MNKINRIPILLTIGLLILQIGLTGPVHAGHGKEQAIISVDKSNLAISGYDTVAYFTDSQAVKGSKEFEYTWRNARWNFSSIQHRALFISNPEKYAPQFGAFCALGVTFKTAVPIDPLAWTIVEGKLYLNYNTEYRDKWREQQKENIEKANLVWMEHNNAT